MPESMKLFTVWFVLLASCTTLTAWSDNYLRIQPDSCQKIPAEQPLNQVLPCYLLQPDAHYQWEIISQSDVASENVTLYTIQLNSLKWSIGEQAGVDHPIWKHRVDVYVPKSIKHNTSLLYINGGTLYPEPKPSEPNSKEINFQKIALETHSVVINLRDIPNQFLTFKHSKPLKEDDLIAYTWKRFLDDPENNRQWPLRLPMVKSTIRAMDMVQELLTQKKVTVDNFVVSGGSKRGWTAWLTAAMDKRVTAVVPAVIDILNLRPSMHHHHKAYGRWAPAVNSYYELMPTLDSPQMDKLLAIVDPYSYRNQLSLPKFLINASADDFFLPDSSQFYWDDLLGKKWMRVLPNLRHYIVRMEPELVTDTLESFYGAFIEERPLPSLSWETREDSLIVHSSMPPKSARLWKAFNPSARDFRATADNPDVEKFQSEPIKFDCKENCRFELDLKDQGKGWRAYFIDTSYSNEPYADITISTRVFIHPATYPVKDKPLDE
ncbi:hypothetical protein ACH42_07700 [Endozoicomonas sp. (ex Bugula neritina AB1)]|nr:hypothetical protein ACH42_07700 [Endozoicomonas sp. (ex Bugula neritina AB1)]